MALMSGAGVGQISPKRSSASLHRSRSDAGGGSGLGMRFCFIGFVTNLHVFGELLSKTASRRTRRRVVRDLFWRDLAVDPTAEDDRLTWKSGEPIWRLVVWMSETPLETQRRRIHVVRQCRSRGGRCCRMGLRRTSSCRQIHLRSSLTRQI